MTLNEYQKATSTTVIYPQIGHGVVYPILGLTGEAGEMANKVKKIFRDDDGKITDEKRKDLTKELGDVLWYVSQIATELELDLDAVAAQNLERLQSRQKRGTLHGDGDNR